MDFEIPEDIADPVGVQLDVETKQKILGLNAAKLYGIDPGRPRREARGRRVQQKAAA